MRLSLLPIMRIRKLGELGKLGKLAIVLSFLGSSTLALAQESGAAIAAVAVSQASKLENTASQTTPQVVKERMRLSDYLIQAKPSEKANLSGMSWQASSEQESQQALKAQLLESLAKLNAPEGDSSFESSRQTLKTLIEKMPTTGRVTLPNSNPRYLQVNPKIDPVLERGDQIQIPDQVKTITLIRTDGLLCKVAYQPNVETRQYFKACRAQTVTTDWAWVIEPDGAVRKVPTAAWNEAKQSLPAPGSWIWAPPRGSVWAKGEAQEFTKLLTQFLATQESSGQLSTVDQTVLERRAPFWSTADRYATSRDLPLTQNIWGAIGNLETATARIAPAGTAALNFSLANPYGQANIFLTPYDFLEFGFTYTNINNVSYGPQATSGNQTYKDKSADIKIRLWQESTYIPEIAVGARDFIGTGLFSGEYFVGTKRYSDFDFSAGLAWGYLGNRNNVKNPFSAISNSYNTRPPPTNATGGTLTGDYFRGPTAIFGGVQYHTPWDPLILKVELDGNNYQNEPYGNVLLSKTPINIGAVYRWGPLDFTVGLRQGAQAMFAVSLHERLDQLATAKIAEPKSVPVDLKAIGNYTPPSYLALTPSTSSESLVSKKSFVATSTTLSNSTIASATPSSNSPAVSTSNANVKAAPGKTSKASNSLANNANANTSVAQTLVNPATVPAPGVPVLNATQTLLDFQTQTAWGADSLYINGNRWIVDLNNATGVFLSDRINKGIGILHRDAPSDITEFTLQFYNWGMLVSTFQVNRTQWMLGQTQLLAPSKKKDAVESLPVDLSTAKTGKDLGNLSHSPWQGELGMAYTQVLGGPDVPLLFSLSAQGQGIYKFRDDAWISSILNLRLVDNFGKFNYDGPTNLPPVRTDIRQYMTTSQATMPNLQMTKTFQPASDQFASIYGGYLEMMFAGAGGEYLYRPNKSKFALGVDINRVYQRQFNQWTSLQNYSVNTGHVTAYWDTGWEDTLVKFSLGQYLAGDRGGTLDLSRVFGNGVKIGAYVTRTNVNYQQFGEGSFDKGLYVAVPFDAFFGVHSDSTANLLWTPLIRDGGAKLFRQYPLYDLTNSRDNRALITGPVATGN